MARRPSAVSQTPAEVPELEVVCPLIRDDGKICKKRCMGEKRFRSMQEHIRRAHPEYHIPKLPATEESFMMMINTPPGANARSEESAKARKSIGDGDQVPARNGEGGVDVSLDHVPNSFLDDIVPSGQNGDGSASFSDDMFKEQPPPTVSAPNLPVLKAVEPTGLDPSAPDFASNFMSDPVAAMTESSQLVTSSGQLHQVTDTTASIWGDNDAFGIDGSNSFPVEADTTGLITMSSMDAYVDGVFSLFPTTNEALEHSQQQPVFLNDECGGGIWNSMQTSGLPGSEPENHLPIEMPSTDELHHQFIVDENSVEAGDADPLCVAASFGSFGQRRASVPTFHGVNGASKPRVNHSRKMSVPETHSQKNSVISSVPSPIRKRVLKRKHTDAAFTNLPEVKEEAQPVEKASRLFASDHETTNRGTKVAEIQPAAQYQKRISQPISPVNDKVCKQQLPGANSAILNSKPVINGSRGSEEQFKLPENTWPVNQSPELTHFVASTMAMHPANSSTAPSSSPRKSLQTTNGSWMGFQTAVTGGASDEILKYPEGVAQNIMQGIQPQQETSAQSLAMPKGPRIPLHVEPWLSQGSSPQHPSLRKVGIARIQLDLEFQHDQQQIMGGDDGDYDQGDGQGHGERAAKRLCTKSSADSMLMIPTITLPNLANGQKSAELSPPTLSVLSHERSGGYPWNLTVTLPNQPQSTTPSANSYSVPIYEVPSELSREMGLHACTPPQTSTTDSGIGFESPPGNNPLTPVSAATTPSCGPNQQGLGSPVPDLRLRQSKIDLDRLECILAALQFPENNSESVQIKRCGMVTEASQIVAKVKAQLV